MSGEISYVMTNNNISCMIDNQPFNFTREHPFFNEVKEAIKNGDSEKVKKLSTAKLDVEYAVAKIGNGKVEYKDGNVSYNGRVLHTSIANRIVEMAKDGFSIDHMIKFLENLMQNPSRSSVEELYDFLENKNIPITNDGCFLAYKAVCSDYMDKHSRRYANTVGAVIEMERNEVDDDRRNECSYGFHVGALEYSGPNGYFFDSGDRCMIVKVNPKDVVAVPKDYNCQKMRVCRYEVHGEYQNPLNNAVYDSNGEELDSDYDDDYSISTMDLCVGDTVDFEYTDAEGDVTNRVGVLVDKVDFIDDYIIGLEYNDYTGKTKTRRFNFDGMESIYYSE